MISKGRAKLSLRRAGKRSEPKLDAAMVDALFQIVMELSELQQYSAEVIQFPPRGPHKGH